MTNRSNLGSCQIDDIPIGEVGKTDPSTHIEKKQSHCMPICITPNRDAKHAMPLIS